MEKDWNSTYIADEETHHLRQGSPVYGKKFLKVFQLHAPGLAAVLDSEGAYHINLLGQAIYLQRFLQTFGYYQNLAAVESIDGWYHITTQGNPAYVERYAWCGNFQESLCVVQDRETKQYYHIDTNGHRIYPLSYQYVGDYKDGYAVICNEQGLHTHINAKGEFLHEKWFLGLDVFHKGVARAKDAMGWFHVDKQGKPIYRQRYRNIEPFYNNIAHVEDDFGNLFTIDLSGQQVTTIYKQHKSYLHELSSDLVGFWKTQTIYAAVKLGIFDALPAKLDSIAAAIRLQPALCLRLLRALEELKLVQRHEDTLWQLTSKGALLQPSQKSPMAAAAIVWGNSHYQQWTKLIECLSSSKPQTEQYFLNLSQDSSLLPIYHRALQGYAAEDYNSILTAVDWEKHQFILDVGGGVGVLVHKILAAYPHLHGILYELPEVVALVEPHPRCVYLGGNILEPWGCQADAIILARVLHDWNDEQALCILRHAKNSLLPSGRIYILEMVLESDSANSGLLDLNMLVMTGGCERSQSDWQELAKAAHLSLQVIYNLSGVVSLLVLAEQ